MVFRPTVDAQLCFVLMPFNDLHSSYFKAILSPAVESLGLRAVKADQIYGTGAIIQDIWRSIWNAQVVIADVTGKNPNVNYELGLCHALGVPTILISQSVDDVPFDYRHRRCIIYDTKAIDWQKKLEHDIHETVKAVLAGDTGKEELEWPYDTRYARQMETSGPFVPSEAARDSVLRGIEAAQEAIAMSLGPHGTSVLTSSTIFGGRLSKSGIAIASALNSTDPIIQLGIDRVRDLTREVSAELGDGTKSSALLFCEMVRGGYQAVKSGALLRELVTEMDVAVEKAVAYLVSTSRPASEDTVSAVASAAALGNVLDAHIAVSALNNAGADGLIYLEDSPTLKTDLLVREGMHFNRGFLSNRFITDEPRQLAILQKVRILLCSFQVNAMQYLLPILEQVARAGESLLLVADDVEGEALATLEINTTRGTIASAAVKSPGFGPTRELILEDVAVAAGGTVISHPSLLHSARLPQLGFAESVEVAKNHTWLIRPRGDAKQVELRAAGIRQQITVAGPELDAERLRERLASLVGASVSIRVGGVSESDRSERKARIGASLQSARAVAAQGAVLGGGSALWRTQEELARTTLTIGARVISEALSAPLRAQVRNSRVPFGEISQKLNEVRDADAGFDASRRGVSNLKDAQILDATKTVVRGLQIAFAHARNVILTGAWEIPGPSIAVEGGIR